MNSSNFFSHDVLGFELNAPRIFILCTRDSLYYFYKRPYLLCLRQDLNTYSPHKN